MLLEVGVRLFILILVIWFFVLLVLMVIKLNGLLVVVVCVMVLIVLGWVRVFEGKFMGCFIKVECVLMR